MKFAVFIALCLISQCVVIDAIYVTCRIFDRQAKTTYCDRRNIRNKVNYLYNVRSSHYNTIRKLESRVSCLYPEMRCVQSIMRSASSYLSQANTKLRDIKNIINNHESRLRKLETWDTCAFREDVMLCLVERFLAKNPNF